MKQRTALLGSLLVAALLALGWFVFDGSARRSGEPPTGVGPAPMPPTADATHDELEPTATPSPLPTVPAKREPRLSPRAEELARGLVVEGRVVFPPGTPADERVFVEARGRTLASGGTDEVEVARDGAFRVAFAERTKSGELVLRGHYLFAKPLAWHAEEPRPITFAPTLGARIAGRVVASDGRRPTPGDRVRLYVPELVHGPGTGESSFAAVSSSGGFEFFALDALTTPSLVYDGAELLGSVSVHLIPGASLPIELRVTPGVALAGRVVDEAGVGLAGVTVRSGPSPDGIPARRASTTRSEGGFRLAALEPGEHEITAIERGYLPFRLPLGTLKAGEKREDLVLRLARGGTIAGRLLWTDGTPVHGGVRATDPESGAVLSVNGDADGSFELSGLAAERYDLRAMATRRDELEMPGAEPMKRLTSLVTELHDVAVGTRDLELRFEAGLTVDGSVAGADGSPQRRFRIHATPLDSEQAGLAPERRISQLVYGSAGRFQLIGLTPGPWLLTASSSEFEDSLPVEVELPASAPVELVLRTKAELAGRVIDARGLPVADAWVELFSQPESGHHRMVESEADGTFVFDGILPGRWFLRASAEGHARSALESLELRGDPAPALVLALRRPGTIEGEAADQDGRPLLEQDVSLRGSTEGHSTLTTTDAEGRFRFTGLPADEYELSAYLDGAHASARVLVDAGSIARVRLTTPAGTVRLSGLVRVDGEPARGARVSTGEAGTRCGSDGEFTLALPGPGLHTLELELTEFEPQLSVLWPLEIAHASEQRCELSIELARVWGHVTADGEPAQVDVYARGESGSGPELVLSSASCDADGRYVLLVVPGRITVSAGGPPATAWAEASRTVVVASGQELLGVDLELSRGARIRGRALFEDGPPATGVTAWIEGAGSRTSTLVDVHGFFDVSGLAPGQWRVTAAGAGAATRAPLVVMLAAGETQRCELTLVPAAMVEVRLAELPSGERRWLTLLDDAGHPIEGPMDPGARAHFGPLAFGRYRLRVEQGGESREHPFELASTRAVVLTLGER